jgi:hypothetical protein
LFAPALPDASEFDTYAYFELDPDWSGSNHRDPHGPANLLLIYKFCELVDMQILQNAHRSTAFCVSELPESRIQAAMLLGAYMIMRHDVHPDDAMNRLAPALVGVNSAFRDAYSDSNRNRLQLRDCLGALHRSRNLGWIRFADSGDHGDDASFDPEEYAYFDNLLNADLHELVPGRLLVTSCPRLLPDGAMWADRYDAAGRFLARDFSPAFAIDHLAQFDVSLCIRVGVPRYGSDALAGSGLDLLDMYIEDDGVPDQSAVARFLAAVDAAAPRAVVVQGDGMRGPATALAGAYLVRRHGFTGQEAAAWLRMVRPGCVSGEQLRFLVATAAAESAASAAAADSALLPVH